MPDHHAPHDCIRLRGVRQNNLKDLDLDLPHGELIVVTGVSGSGKSSLAFDTVYAEGQRRYVETFSPYARQFLDRMDRPAADRIEGIPPAIAIDQTNPVRTSRSTVGTLTEINDHLKLLLARAARLFCRGCGREVRRDTPASVWEQLQQRAGDGEPLVLIAFPVPVPESLGRAAVKQMLAQQGYVRLVGESESSIEVIQDRLRLSLGEPRPRGRGPRDRAQQGARPVAGLPARRGPATWRPLALLLGSPLSGLRHRLSRPDPESVLVQFAGRRLRDLPGVRPDHRHRLGPGRTRHLPVADRGRRQAHPIG